jgi:hypothetical protein
MDVAIDRTAAVAVYLELNPAFKLRDRLSVRGRLEFEILLYKSESVMSPSKVHITKTFSNDGGPDIAIIGESKGNEAVRGLGHSAHPAVVGINDSLEAGNGAWFESSHGEGVRGWSMNPDHGGVVGVNTAKGIGVYGTSDAYVGVWGTSKEYEGVHAETQSSTTAAMAAYQNNPTSDTAAFYAKHVGNRNAAVFEGNIVVTGDITLANADCAEDFSVSPGALIEPGTVMVFSDTGDLRAGDIPYDKRVAGVISGAGHFKPGITLDRQSTMQNRVTVALLGKVYCKVDAGFGHISVGDLLTTSSTLGHAMRAADPAKSFGTVIGKAMSALAAGTGLIPILVALQ